MEGLIDVMTEVVGERAASKGDKKHYIPFTHEEFSALRTAFGKDSWMPDDFKRLLVAIGDGRFKLSKAVATTKAA